MQLVRINRLGISNRVSYDPDALAWANALAANGGSLSSARLAIVSKFISAEKVSGAWLRTDDYLGLWAESPTQALTSLKQRRLATAINSPLFTVDKSYAGDGASSYIDSGFNPSLHAGVMTGGDMQLSWYELTNLLDASFIGAIGTGNRFFRGRSRFSSNQARLDMNASGTVATGIADSRGYWDFVRTPTPNWIIYRNAVDQSAVRGSSYTTSLLSDTVPILAHKVSGSPDTFSARSIGFFAVGASLTAAQIGARYAAVQAWATAIGANV